MNSQKNNSGLSIVIPLFNEVENIDHLFDKIFVFLSKADFQTEIILVDGCSDDGSKEKLILNSSRKGLEGVRVLSLESRNGYGFDIVEGLKVTKYDHLAWTHADLQTDLNDLVTGYDLLVNDKDEIIVKGRRRNRPILDSFLTFGMQLFVRFCLKISLSDINAQPKMFSRDFLQNYILKDYPNDFSLDLFLLTKAKLNKYDIKSFPVTFKKRQFGQAKGGGGSIVNRFKLIKRTLLYIISHRRRF